MYYTKPSYTGPHTAHYAILFLSASKGVFIYTNSSEMTEKVILTYNINMSVIDSSL